MITKNLSTLKIHKLTQEQYNRELEAGRVDPSALYLTPEEDNSIFVQNEEPEDAEDGALWIDLDADGASITVLDDGDGNVIVKNITTSMSILDNDGNITIY